MSSHSIAEAKNQLSKLIARAEKGEQVVLTRHGKPVAEIKSIPAPPRRMTQADIDWLNERRIPRLSSTEDAASLVRKMRDESP